MKSEIKLKPGIFSLEGHNIILDGKSVHLPRCEYMILKYLYQFRGKVKTRNEILVMLGYQEVEYLDTRLVDQHINRLRKRMGRSAWCIKTIPYYGYKFQ